MALPFDVTDDTFQAEVLQSNLPVLVDFWAEWCPPCHMIAPSVKEIAAEYDGRLRVAKLNTDENPGVPGRYGIVGLPTLMLFKDGEVIARLVGALPKPRLVAQLAPHLQPVTA